MAPYSPSGSSTPGPQPSSPNRTNPFHLRYTRGGSAEPPRGRITAMPTRSHLEQLPDMLDVSAWSVRDQQKILVDIRPRSAVDHGERRATQVNSPPPITVSPAGMQLT